jgi:hypothetical protein
MTLCVPTPPADNGVLRLRTARGWVSATAADGTVILEQVVAAGEASSAAVARPAEGGEGGGAPTHRLVNKTIVRVDSALTSKKACVLKPGEEVTVLEQRTLESGTTRLRIDRGWLSEATSAGVAIVEPIGQPPPPQQQPSDQPSQKAPAKGAGAQRRRQPQPQQREEEKQQQRQQQHEEQAIPAPAADTAARMLCERHCVVRAAVEMDSPKVGVLDEGAVSKGRSSPPLCPSPPPCGETPDSRPAYIMCGAC